MQTCDRLAQRAETETNTEYEGRGQCNPAIGWPRPKQTRNIAAQRAGAEMDPGYRQSGNWLVGGEPWLRDPAHPGADISPYSMKMCRHNYAAGLLTKGAGPGMGLRTERVKQKTSPEIHIRRLYRNGVKFTV
jgi:hypothetical protein